MELIEFAGIFLASFGMALLVRLTHPIHGRWTGDFQDSGVQKHHHGNPARIGLLPLVAGAGMAVIWLRQSDAGYASEAASMLATLLLCAAPAALCGLLEDVTKKVRARWRLLGPMVGVGLGWWLMGALIPATGIPGLDDLVTWWPLALGLTLLLLVGFTHAMNIVDGLNGLASGLALLMLMGTAYAAHHAGDAVMFQVCAALAVAVLGFMALNFPRGLMFLGDGGAYFLGFIIAQIWVLLLVRNPGEISPWFTMALAVHPTMETVFSIVRRKLRRRHRNATAPDRLHLHTLVFRRRMRPLFRSLPWAEPWVANASASLMVLCWAALPMLLATQALTSTGWTMLAFVAYALLYLLQFRSLVRFRGGMVQGIATRRVRALRSPAAQLGAVSVFDGQAN